MNNIKKLFENNRNWAEMQQVDDPDFFNRLAAQHNPKYMWIGCSDSRVPANEIIGLEPGRVFVHRNVANQVQHSDLNMLSAVQYAVEALKVEHIVVTGHYGCGGVLAAMGPQCNGIVDNWIRGIRDTYVANSDDLQPLDEAARRDRLCELNVMRQVENLCHTGVVQNAWDQGQSLTIHGWIYRIQNGLLHDLKVTSSNADGVEPVYRVR